MSKHAQRHTVHFTIPLDRMGVIFRRARHCIGRLNAKRWRGRRRGAYMLASVDWRVDATVAHVSMAFVLGHADQRYYDFARIDLLEKRLRKWRALASHQKNPHATLPT